MATAKPANQPLIIAMVASLTSRTKKHATFVEAAGRLKNLTNIEFRIYGHDLAGGGSPAWCDGSAWAMPALKLPDVSFQPIVFTFPDMSRTRRELCRRSMC